MATTIEALTSADDGQPGEKLCTCGEPLEVAIETMPEWLRASHKAARNSGVHPHNGAERTRCCRQCAQVAVDADPDWTTIVGED